MANDLIVFLNREAKKLTDQAQAIVDTADAEGRALKAEEKVEFESLIDEAKRLKGKVAEQVEKETFRKMIEETPSATDGRIPTAQPGPDQQYGTIGEAFIHSGAFKAVVERRKGGSLGDSWRSETVHVPWISGYQPRGQKGTANPILESGDISVFGNTSTVGTYTTTLGLEAPGFRFMRLVVADLLNNVPVATPNVNYPVVKGRDTIGSGDVPVPEGQEKTAIGYEFDNVVEQLFKIACYTKASEEWLDDAPALAAYINGDLPFQVRQAEEVYLATALYAATSDATPLVNAANGFDAILAAKTEIQMAGFEPTGLLVSPTNWAEMRAAKLVGGTGEYVAGGPFAATNNPWDLTVVVTPAATDDHPLVGDFARGARIFRRGGISVDATNSDGTDFIKNLITIRAEERLLLGKTYPEAFVTADITVGS